MEYSVMRQLRLGQFSGILAAAGLWMLLPPEAIGQVIAFDDGSDAAYADGWDEGDNGGFGFGPWSVGDSVIREIDTDGLEPDNGLGTPAFRFGADSNVAVRPFESPMEAGQSFNMKYDQYAFDPTDPPDGVYLEQDSLFRFSSAGGERLSLYKWIGKFTFGGQTTTYNADEWGIGATTAFDNLNGGAPLPNNGGGLWMTGYTGPESIDGFSLSLELPTIDTYRLRIVDDDVTQVDVSGTLNSMADPDGPGPLPPGDVTGQGLESILMWFTPGDFSTGFPTAYFTNLEITETATPPGGDHNGDGKVDAADYVAWRKNPAGFGGDPGGYDTWRANFGAISGGGNAFSVPEPCSAVLMLLGCTAACFLRRSR
jgi:hypothetical protein